MSGTMTMQRRASSRPSVEDAAPLREQLAVDLEEGETLSAADLLRLLDRVRQELSCHLVGGPGAFVGYDNLDVPQATVEGPGRVIVEARLRDRTERLHDVEYLAVSVQRGAERPGASDPLLVRGTGRTLHVGCVPSRPTHG